MVLPHDFLREITRCSDLMGEKRGNHQGLALGWHRRTSKGRTGYWGDNGTKGANPHQYNGNYRKAEVAEA